MYQPVGAMYQPVGAMYQPVGAISPRGCINESRVDADYAAAGESVSRRSCQLTADGCRLTTRYEGVSAGWCQLIASPSPLTIPPPCRHSKSDLK
jgi:hypothetical protein